MSFHRPGRKLTARKIAAVCAAVVLMVIAGTLCAAESRINWAVKAYEKNRDAVVCIQGDKIDESANSSSREAVKAYNGMGTGIIIDERGYIITNFHVVEGIRKIQVSTFDRTQYYAELVARDPDTDLAIIKINARKPLKTITLGRSDDLMPGENCLAIGNPFGYDFSLTDGRISGIGREVEVNDTLVYRDAIQTNTEINPGNSGGPLVNIDGEMVGINAAIRQGATGIAFAIPVNQVVRVAAKLLGEIAHQSVSHGLKVEQTDSESGEKTSENAKPSGERYAVVVQSVESGSAAAESGIRTGDVIRQIGKYSVGNVLDFSRALLDVQEKDDLSFSVSRDSETRDVAVAMGSPKGTRQVLSQNRQMKTADVTPKVASPFKVSSLKTSPLDELVWDTLGIRYTPVPKDEYRRKFSQFLTERPHGGVAVKEVKDGSQMSEAGVMQGDVIVGIHEWVTTSENDVRYIAKNWQNIRTPDGKVKLLLFRDNTPYFTELPLK
ncbi:MAG: trypsin-like peptidase domain-containing protein [Planctomycetaceae bacterium]|jgi:serine protease Do|nr:trypsin-like peptidase domain-containing protein [Planctomycetaceae bacterium]